MSLQSDVSNLSPLVSSDRYKHDLHCAIVRMSVVGLVVFHNIKTQVTAEGQMQSSRDQACTFLFAMVKSVQLLVMATQ